MKQYNVKEVGGIKADEQGIVDLDSTSGKIIELGTITYGDINTAPFDVSISLYFTGFTLPANYYIEKLFVNTVYTIGGSPNAVIFDSSGTSIFSDNYDSGTLNNCLNQSDGDKSIYYINCEKVYPADDNTFYITLSFLANDGVTPISNPQDFTSGEVTIKALIKKFPI